jgi:hypothetical protein
MARLVEKETVPPEDRRRFRVIAGMFKGEVGELHEEADGGEYRRLEMRPGLPPLVWFRDDELVPLDA